MRDSSTTCVSEAWDKGFQHYSKGNYFAARDYWKSAWEQSTSTSQKARTSNGLGVAAFYLANPEEAQVYFERANAFSLRSETTDPLRIRYLTNLAQVLLHGDHNDAAVQTANEAARLVSTHQPEDSANALAVCVSVFRRNELYRDVIKLYDRWQDIHAALPESARDVQTANFLHNVGYAAQAMNDTESALQFYREAHRTFPLPTTNRELSKLYLLQGDVHTSMVYAQSLYDSVWEHGMLAKKAEIAETLVLIGMFAYFAGNRALFDRCVEKAELYFGQVSHWDQWLKMRELSSVLAAHPDKVQSSAVEWERWTTLLDDLTLSDSLESLFPGKFRMAQIATHLAGELAERIGLTEGHQRQNLIRAGRLAYLGLTALCTNDADARRLLNSSAAAQEVAQLSVRLLEVYPHSEQYRRLIEYNKSGRDSPLPPEDAKLAHCLGIAFDYVESVEMGSLSHEEAVRKVLAGANARYNVEVIGEFARHMDANP